MKTILNMMAATGLSLAATVLTGTAASAQSSSCQADFQKFMGPRQALIERINGFRTKRPTPAQACSTLGQLVSADQRLNAWLSENKDWCQIPEQVVEQAQGSSGQAVRARAQACTAAKSQASQIARARAAQQQQEAGGGGNAPAPVGSGVRLPQGAL
jgi:hypothetical protein